MVRYLRVKKEKVGVCNICKKVATLCWDHVPPEGGTALTAVEMESLLDRISSDRKEFRPGISQNDLKYRTICESCNNKIGRLYDPVLIQFAQDVGQFLKSKLQFPDVLHVETRPTALIRAVVAHLLASSMHHDAGLGGQHLNRFLFDQQASVPEQLSVFYWVYPYTSIAVVRDIAMPAVRGSFNEFGGFNLLKFFPIAYLVTDLPRYENLTELTQFRLLPPAEQANVPIYLRSIKDSMWPDVVDSGNLIAGGATMESSIYARPRTKGS
jgi:hypothetical protein